MKTSRFNENSSAALFETATDSAAEKRLKLNAMMNKQLATAIDLQTQTKQAHWNVKGSCFMGLHELFDMIYVSVESYVDMIAERIVQLGGVAQGTARVTAGRSMLSEYPLDIADGSVHVEALTKALSTFDREARNGIAEAIQLDDTDTADMFSEITRGVDKWLRFVETHSQADKK